MVLSEPGGSYLTHFTPRSGKAIHLAAELHTISQQYGSGGGDCSGPGDNGSLGDSLVSGGPENSGNSSDGSGGGGGDGGGGGNGGDGGGDGDGDGGGPGEDGGCGGGGNAGDGGNGGDCGGDGGDSLEDGGGGGGENGGGGGPGGGNGSRGGTGCSVSGSGGGPGSSGVKVLGCDGTAVNTGATGGACRLFELASESPVHWFICQIHANELNLRHVFLALDGTTSGPRSWTGPLGRSCQSEVWRKDVVSFVAVPGLVDELPDKTLRQLSTDQELLYRLARSVQRGSVPVMTAKRKIGELNHARWLTLGSRLLRLYMSTETPSAELRQLVEFLLLHYIPMWFSIRQHSSCVFGSKNFFRSVELLRQLPEEIQDIVRPVMQRNGFWAHPEQLLLAMVADEDAQTRRDAIQHITGARQRDTAGVRPFRMPRVNFRAAHYTQLIDWETEMVTEPPLLRHLGSEELAAIVAAPHSVPAYPVHTQAVERFVRMVTEASSRVLGEEARHGLINARLQHRRKLPVFNTKRDALPV